MNRPTPVSFELESPPEEVLRKLEARFPSRVEDPSPNVGASPRIYLDTFDGRLHAAERTLVFTAGPRTGSLELEALDGARIRRARTKEPPAFAGDLPRGPLAEAVAPLIEVRRLLPVAELRRDGPRIRVLDELDKTVVRLEVLTGTVAPADGPQPWPGDPPDAAPLPPRLLVRPVRGYDEAFQGVTVALETELGLPRTEQDLLTVALGLLGRRPRGYGSKRVPEVEPEMPAAEAARAAYRELLATIRANEEGTRLGLDPEFLHDFRVAVRRTRSALGQVKGVFPEPEVERFKKEFKWLGRATGPTRDLDVYRIKLPRYRQALGERVGSHLDPLYRFLAEHQEIEQAKMARALRSKRYRELLDAWQSFLDEETPPAEAGPPNARRPIREVVSARISKLWRRVGKRGRAITPETEASALHRLRIDCKKLRYLLELFGGLYPEDQIRPLVKSLKKLQDNLGDFNDYEVQQKRLEIFADRMVDEDLAPVPTLLVLGRLLEHLARGQDKEHRRFDKRFRQFTAKTNRRRFERLFHTETEG